MPVMGRPTPLLVLLLAACGAGETSGVFTQPETPSFGIATRSPGPGRSGIPVTTSVIVGFSANIDPNSVAYSAVSLDGRATGTLTISGTTLRFTPAVPLVPGTAYAVSVAPGLRGANGIVLGSTPTWGFKTAGVPPPIDTLLAIGQRPR